MEQFVEFFSENLVLFTALFVILFFLLRTWLPSSVIGLRPAEAVRLANAKDAIYLDVRTDDEYKEGHILDTLHIPLGLLSGRIGELSSFKSSPIIIYCRSGARSAQAGSILKKHGFSELYHISGGVAAWQQGSLPLTKKDGKQKKLKKVKAEAAEKAEPAPESTASASVLMYVTKRCPFCLQAKHLLKEKGVKYSEIDLDLQPEKRAEMEQRSGGRDTVPQIFVGNHHVGGCDDLYDLEKRGELDSLLGLLPAEDNASPTEMKSLAH